MDQQEYIITFDKSSVADANRWASELKEVLLEATPDIKVRQQNTHPYSQDFGTTLVLVLGTPVVVVVAKALGNWLLLHRETSITIKTAQGEIVGTNITTNDALKLAELLLAQQKKK